jgi:endonuclease/exonuclease/phosphatase (EEP) superfamily protein YafD
VKSAFKRWLRIAATASLIVSVTPLIATLHWIPELFTHFRVQLIVGQLALLPALLIVGDRHLGTVIGLCALVNAVSIYQYLLPSSSANPPPSALRVVSANVLSNNRKTDALLGIIEQESPDVVLILEYTTDWAKRLTPLASSYPHRIELPRSGNFGIALFSRLPIEESRELSLLGYAAVDVDIVVDKKIVRIVGVHLQPPTSGERARRRNEQLEELAEDLSSQTGRIVVVGDFNLTPYSPWFQRFLDVTALKSTFVGHGPGMTWPTRLPLLGIPIDHCFVSQTLEVSDYRRLPEFGSDHFPIVVDLALRGSP